MNIPCPNVIPCPGSDWPILNLSSEGFDHLTFAAPFPDPENPYSPPDVYHPVNYTDCHGVVYSNISQEIADLLALFDAINCKEDGQICVNAAQTATRFCQDGTSVSYTTPAGTFAHGYDPNTAGSLAACQATVDGWALAYAQAQLALLPPCPDTITDSCTITTSSPLPNGTVGVAYSKRISGTGLSHPHAFTVTAGTLPPGLTMDGFGNITGTPTTAGTYTFTVTLTETTATPPEPEPPTTTIPTPTVVGSVSGVALIFDAASLVAGQKYQVSFLASTNSTFWFPIVITFTATASTWHYEDPGYFASSGTGYIQYPGITFAA